MLHSCSFNLRGQGGIRISLLLHRSLSTDQVQGKLPFYQSSRSSFICCSKWSSNYFQKFSPHRNRTLNYNTRPNEDILRTNLQLHRPMSTESQSENKNTTEGRVFTVPNLLSAFRIAATPYIGYLVLTANYTDALIWFAVASLTDLFDGAIARRWPSQQSSLGTILDPLGDKVLVATACGCLTYANIIPLYLTCLFLLRDVSLIMAGVFVRYRTCPRPVTLARYFDPSLVNIEVTASTLSKVNTALQMSLLWMSMAAPVFNFVDHDVLKLMWGITASTTIMSALGYAIRRDAFRVTTPKKEKPS